MTMLAVDHVIVLTSPSNSREMVELLRAAIQEVEKLYNYDENRVDFEIFKSSVSREKLQESMGGYSGTYEREKLAGIIRDSIGSSLNGTKFVITTDLEITPPRDLRYIIWGGVENGTVVSLAPIDPIYWRILGNDRMATLKQRARAAYANIVGSYLGLERCDNQRCFLFRNVNSPTQLDEMVYLGAEHGLKKLAKFGFSFRSGDPRVVQRLVTDPSSERNWVRKE